MILVGAGYRVLKSVRQRVFRDFSGPAIGLNE